MSYVISTDMSGKTFLKRCCDEAHPNALQALFRKKEINAVCPKDSCRVDKMFQDGPLFTSMNNVLKLRMSYLAS